MKIIIIEIIIAVSLLVIVLFKFSPHFQWDGRAFRQIKVIVQTTDGSAIMGAVITYRDREYDWIMGNPEAIPYMSEKKMQIWRSQHFASGNTERDGSFMFKVLFPAGGTRILFWNNDQFTIRGTISVQAEGYHTLERSLSELVGQENISLRKYRRESIIIRCNLEKK